MTVLVVDHGYSTRCGIRDLGVRIAERLGARHVDCNSAGEYDTAVSEHAPDAIIVNYRADLMPWWRPSQPIPELGVLHQYGPSTVDLRAAELLARGFDHVLVLDPTVTPVDPRVHAVGRPLPSAPVAVPWHPTAPPRIGSFGFAFPHKGFGDVASEVATVFGATYRLHMPEAYFNGANGALLYTDGILADISDRLAPDGRFDATSHEMEPDELVHWLAGNTVNCLLYAPGQPEAGLSSALDYLIAARRPIMVSEAEMFAAAQGRAAVWPDLRLVDVLAKLDYWEAEAGALWDLTYGRFEANVRQVLDSL